LAKIHNSTVKKSAQFLINNLKVHNKI